MRKADLLEFNCVSCNKPIRPLTFFDGSIWCPKCEKDLFKCLKNALEKGASATSKAIVKKKSSKDAEEEKRNNAACDFALSQELFARYLCGAEGSASEALDKAIIYCRKAAYALHPYALLNLGYYYSLGYDPSVHMETGRAFAKLCFDIAKQCAPNDDQAFNNLLLNNSEALVTPIEKNALGDEAYLAQLYDKMNAADKFVAPRIGVFSVKKSSLLPSAEEGKDPILKGLKKLLQIASIYKVLLPTNTRSHKEMLSSIDQPDEFKNCFKEGEDVVWFVYVRKGPPIGRFKGDISSVLRLKEEIDQNIPIIRRVAADKGNRSADFSDQDLLISTFLDPKELLGTESSGEKEGKNSRSPFDCLSKIYEIAQIVK